MKQIFLKTIKIENFKGIKNLEILFDDELTNIHGANGTGKTSIFDAFTWMLFGKDSSDRKDFNIKNTVETSLNRQDHEVSATIYVDAELVSIRRIFKEKWQKTRGSEEQEFKGNESEFYWNDVPVSLSEFNAKVNSIVNEQVFKMITSPSYFNSIEWKQRRAILTEIAGQISDEELAKGNDAYEKLISQLTQGKTLDDYKAQVLASVKKAKDDLKAIPTRIDEVSKTKPEAQDFTALEKDFQSVSKKIEKLDKSISDNQQAFQLKLDSQRDLKLRANDIASELEIIRSEAKKEAGERLKPNTTELDSLVTKKNDLILKVQMEERSSVRANDDLAAEKLKLSSLEKEIDTIRQNWNSRNAEAFVFDETKCECPTCKRAFESDKIEETKAEMLLNFNNKKVSDLNSLKESGLLKAKAIELSMETIKSLEETFIAVYNKNIVGLREEISSLDTQIDVLNKNNQSEADKPSFQSTYEAILSLNPDYELKNKEYLHIQELIGEEIKVDNQELSDSRKLLVQELDEIKSKLRLKEQIDAVDARIDALKAEEKTLSQQIANVEKTVFAIEGFEKLKSDRTESLVNEKFTLVKFRMFEEQINGGLKPTCEALVNGVPISDANTASRINAGIDIINTLSNFYQVTAPIIIDNKESVSQIIDTPSQVVCLVVNPEYKSLTIIK